MARANLLPDGRRPGDLVSVGQGGAPGLEEMVIGVRAVEICIQGIVIDAFLVCREAAVDEADPQAKVMALGLDMDITKQGDVMVFPSYDYCRGFALSVRCVSDTAD